MSTFNQREFEVKDEEGGLYKVNTEFGKKPLKSGYQSRWWSGYGEKIILTAGVILIAAISFQAGFVKGQKNPKNPIVVNQPTCAPCPQSGENKIAGNATGNNQEQNNSTKTEDQSTTENQTCSFIASKNSNKYHLATCQWATRIKPENKICFSSKEEAQNRGYQSAKCCIK